MACRLLPLLVVDSAVASLHAATSPVDAAGAPPPNPVLVPDASTPPANNVSVVVPAASPRRHVPPAPPHRHLQHRPLAVPADGPLTSSSKQAPGDSNLRFYLYAALFALGVVTGWYVATCLSFSGGGGTCTCTCACACVWFGDGDGNRKARRASRRGRPGEPAAVPVTTTATPPLTEV
jgi:hypothetical protein